MTLFKKSKIFDYKVAIVLETIRNTRSLSAYTKSSNIDYIINYLEKQINDPTAKIDSKTIRDFRLALPKEGTSLINLKKSAFNSC